MKLGAFILSLLFVGLSIQPVFINWKSMPCINKAVIYNKISPSGCCQKKCNIAKKLPVKIPIKKQENPCDNCNPFMPCNACPYVPEEVQQLAAPLNLEASENTNMFNDYTLSDYNDECWHPPELFSIL